MKDFVYFITLILFLKFVSCFNDGNSTYRAAVMHYSPNLNGNYDIKHVLSITVPEFITFITYASYQNCDIIVFPELAFQSSQSPKKREDIVPFSSIIPPPDEKLSPCDLNYDSMLYSDLALKEVACAVRKAKIYTVVNLYERENCSQMKDVSCGKDGWNFYITSVVFDRNGVVIASARKVHLVIDLEFTPGNPREFPTFKTDFGVEFGIIICFDKVHKHTIDLMEKMGIKNFVSSQKWVQALPLSTANFYDGALAYTYNATILSANKNEIPTRATGSGIYVGKVGAIKQISSQIDESHILIADVPYYPPSVERISVVKSKFPKDENTQLITENNRKITSIHPSIQYHKTKLIDLSENKLSVKETLCHGKFCCNLTAEINKDRSHFNDLRYRFSVFHGLDEIFSDTLFIGVQFCGVLVCLNDSIHSCGEYVPKNKMLSLEFTKLEVTGDFLQNDQTYQLPAANDFSMLFVDPEYFTFEDLTGQRKKMALFRPANMLYMFGIYGRDISIDERHIEQYFSSSSFESIYRLYSVYYLIIFVPFIYILS